MDPISTLQIRQVPADDDSMFDAPGLAWLARRGTRRLLVRAENPEKICNGTSCDALAPSPSALAFSVSCVRTSLSCQQVICVSSSACEIPRVPALQALGDLIEVSM